MTNGQIVVPEGPVMADQLPVGAGRSGRPLEMSFIVRCEGERVSGWQARTPKWHPLGAGSKLFSDSSYGSKDLSLKAAIAHRDAMFQGVRKPSSTWIHRTNAKNTSGLVGVALGSDRRLERNGRTEEFHTGEIYWIAYWSNGKTQTGKRYSVARYGFVRGWELAVAEREKRTGVPFSEYDKAKGRLWCLQRWGELIELGVCYPAAVEEPVAIRREREGRPGC